jgi:hypothetical protein
VQRGVPVAELVAGREAGDARRGGERHRGGELDLGRAGPKCVEERVQDLARLGRQDGLDERGAAVPGAAPRRAPRHRLRKARERILQQCDEVDGIAPGIGLLHTLGEGELSGQ